MTKITIGSDFEMFVWDDDLDKIIPCPLSFGGTKVKPLSIGNGCARQQDCVATEFNIPPANTKQEFIDYINYCKEKGEEILQELDPAYQLVAKSSNIFDPEDLAKSDIYNVFGCSSSINAWSQESREANAEDAGNLRSTGFHVWIGIEDENFTADHLFRIIKSMDLFLGLPSLFIDEDNDRRKIYGHAGDCRYKKKNDLHLLEYRSLGGYLLNSDELIGYVYDQTIKAIEYGMNLDNFIPEIEDVINSQNRELAMEYLQEYNINMIKEPECSFS